MRKKMPARGVTGWNTHLLKSEPYSSTHLKVSEVAKAAQHRWSSLLPRLEIPERYLTRRHSPCPGCGGKDRFRFDNKNGDGTWLCSQGGGELLSGTGFALLSHVHGWSFREALEATADVLGLSDGCTGAQPLPAPRRPDTRTSDIWPQASARERARFRHWLRSAAPLAHGDVVTRYLTNRGLNLPALPRVLRTADRWGYYYGAPKPERITYRPAMLAAIQAADGSLAGVHVTYLEPNGTKAAITHPVSGHNLNPRKARAVARGALRGAMVRLFPAHDKLAIAEGIETALAVHELSGWPVWAALSTSGMAAAVVPRGLRDVLIAADHDENGAGQRAAYALARRLSADGRTVRVAMPDKVGHDWLDVLSQGRQTNA